MCSQCLKFLFLLPGVCSLDTGDDCATNPCGPNAFCEDRVGGHQCSCNPGCTGDPSDGVRGCKCPRHNWDQVCKRVSCGRNAKCRANYQGRPECYCPPEFPEGDPRKECKSDGKGEVGDSGGHIKIVFV